MRCVALDDNRRTQLLLPPALKVAKFDFEPWIADQLANDQGSCAIAEGYFFFHWHVAQQFAVQNLTLPPSMLVAKVIEYV